MASRMADVARLHMGFGKQASTNRLSGIAACRRLQTTDDEREYAAERQHESRVNQKALARAKAIGDPAHYWWDQDRAESLSRLAKSNRRIGAAPAT